MLLFPKRLGVAIWALLYGRCYRPSVWCACPTCLSQMLHSVIHGQCTVGAEKGVTSCLLGSTFRDLGHACRASEHGRCLGISSSQSAQLPLRKRCVHSILMSIDTRFQSLAVHSSLAGCNPSTVQSGSSSQAIFHRCLSPPSACESKRL